MYDEVLFTVAADKAERVDRVSMADLELEERKHLQEWIIANPEILGVGVKVITYHWTVIPIRRNMRVPATTFFALPV